MLKKKEIYTKNAPPALGSYSQAVLIERTLYISGQIALDAQGQKMQNKNITTETQQVFSNLSAVLTAGGATVNNIVRVDIFLTDINDFTIINNLYEQWLGNIQIKPARQTVQVNALPKCARIEISCIAHI